MSKQQSSHHSFSIDEARKYGVEKAILLNNLRYWLDKELAMRDREDNHKIQQKDGATYVWTFNTSRAFAEVFPYMDESSIRRWLRELERDGVIISDNFNKSPYDKTKWYTMPEYQLSPDVGQIDRSGVENVRSGVENDQPIPNTNTDTVVSTKVDTREFDNSRDDGVKKMTPTEMRKFLSGLIGILRHSATTRITPHRMEKLRVRLKTFSAEEIKSAARAVADDPFMQGDNEGGKRYGNIDYLLRSDEVVDRWLEKAQGSAGTPIDLSSVEIPS